MKNTAWEMTFTIPIFITVRGHNKEEFNKNKEALKFSYLFIKHFGLFKQTYIISENKEMLEYAKEMGFINVIYHPCKDDKEVRYLEYLATHKYAVDNNYYPDWIILLNVNQLFKNNSLLIDCINNIDNNYNIIASYTEMTDKSKFFINDNMEIKNKYKREHLLSSEANKVKVIDNSIYAVKTSFAFECMNYEDPSEHFWNTKIKYFKNNSLTSDIYSLKDIQKYYKILDIVNEVKKMK